MELSEQLTSLELSKKLKELAVKQESYFKYELRSSGYFEIFHSKATSISHEYFSAFTASELLEMLPFCIEIEKIFYALEINKSKEGGYILNYNYIINYDNNLPNACAKMLIYLIENNLMEIPK